MSGEMRMTSSEQHTDRSSQYVISLEELRNGDYKTLEDVEEELERQERDDAEMADVVITETKAISDHVGEVPRSEFPLSEGDSIQFPLPTGSLEASDFNERDPQTGQRPRPKLHERLPMGDNLTGDPDAQYPVAQRLLTAYKHRDIINALVDGRVYYHMVVTGVDPHDDSVTLMADHDVMQVSNQGADDDE